MTLPTKQVFIVECRTGCSCCSDENHYVGPFFSRAAIESWIANAKTIPYIASQYSKQGVYHIDEITAECLPDGLLLIRDRVFGPFDDDPFPDRLCCDISCGNCTHARADHTAINSACTHEDAHGNICDCHCFDANVYYSESEEEENVAWYNDNVPEDGVFPERPYRDFGG